MSHTPHVHSSTHLIQHLQHTHHSRHSSCKLTHDSQFISVWNSSFNSCSLPTTPRTPGAGLRLPPLPTEQEFQQHDIQQANSLAPPQYNDQTLTYSSPTEEFDASTEYHTPPPLYQSTSAPVARQEETVC